MNHELFLKNFLNAQDLGEMEGAIKDLETVLGVLYSPNFSEKLESLYDWQDPQTVLLSINRFADFRREEASPEALYRQYHLDPTRVDYQIILIHVVKKCKLSPGLTTDRAISLAASKDAASAEVGCYLLNHSSLTRCHIDDVVKLLQEDISMSQGVGLARAVLKHFYERDELTVVGQLLANSAPESIVHLLRAFSELEEIPQQMLALFHRFAVSRNDIARRAAICCLGKFQSVDTEVLQTLEGALADSDWITRGLSAEAIGRLKLEPGRFVPHLSLLTGDFEGEGWVVAEKAVEALAAYGPLAHDSLAILQKLRDSKTCSALAMENTVDEAMREVLS